MSGKGSVLAEEGKPGREFFIIADGTATVSRSGVRLADLEAGSFFGEMALLDGGCRTATVVADTDLSLFVFSPAEFRSLEEVAPVVALRMLTAMGKRFRLTYDRLDSEPYSAPWSTEFAERGVAPRSAGVGPMIDLDARFGQDSLPDWAPRCEPDDGRRGPRTLLSRVDVAGGPDTRGPAPTPQPATSAAMNPVPSERAPRRPGPPNPRIWP